MKNILLAIDAGKVDRSTVDFACYMARLTHSHLNGIFLENIAEGTVPQLKSLYGLPYVESIVATDLPENRKKMAVAEEHIELFRDACCNQEVSCTTRVVRQTPAKEIISESRFADLLIVGASTSSEKKMESTPTAFVRDVLAGAECPVIIAPYSFDTIDEILFTYDGSRSSVFAIKQFTYLLPELVSKKIVVLQVKESDKAGGNEEDKIRPWLTTHYANFEFQYLEGRATDELFAYLLEKNNIFVVMGAFGRSQLSNFIARSTAELLLKTINLPIFTAHH
ncbi:MAG TPA: universal stress protein [Puia sp.]|nr:universal stress protein [Puia sp.]